MNRQLRDRRDRVAERHDAALARYPARKGDAFQRELQAVVAELTAVTTAADDPGSDPVEVAKIYRWLGDAYFDLGLGKDESALTRGTQAYRRAEELLADAEAPVESAKLDFNYGNTLRGLSGGFDVGLLEAAETRYERAARAFRAHNLPDLAATVDEQLRTIEPQLRLARKQAELQRGFGRLEELKVRLEGAGPAERELIARDLQELKTVRHRGGMQEALAEALDAIGEQVKRHPERFGEGSGDLAALHHQVEVLTDKLRDAQPTPTLSSPSEGTESDIMRLLAERLRNEAATGRVAPDRAARLGDILNQFTTAMTEGGNDLDSMARRAQKMRDLTRQAMDMAMSPSWTELEPEPGSNAHWAVSVLAPLKRYLLAESGRSMLPSEEASAGTSLLRGLMEIEAKIRAAARDEGRVSAMEGEVWRLALAVQEHARRYHLMLARPDFPMARSHAKAKSLFVSGGADLRAAAERLASSQNLELYSEGHRGDYAQVRWNQLCSASVAVFDVGVPEGRPRAQVCYELGLALALGKLSIVAARHGQTLPFDVNISAISLSGDRKLDAELLAGALHQALGSIVWGGVAGAGGAGAREGLAWLERAVRPRLSDGALRVAKQLAERSVDDAVAFRRSIEQLVGMLGADAPAILLPAWPPAYPDALKPRLFHVMPFRPTWAEATRNLAAEVCKRRDCVYSRGDEADAQRIIPGIWNEIARASAVLIDITGHNPNVALELGLVHALGRSYRVVAQGLAEEHMFESLEKVQIHGYGSRPDYSYFAQTVEGLLESGSEREQAV